MNHETPVNKNAALFLSRKKHMTTVQEALNKFAIEVCSPAAVSEIRKIMQDRLKGDDNKQLVLTLRLKSDHVTPNKVSAVMETRVIQQIGHESYVGLDC